MRQHSGDDLADHEPEDESECDPETPRVFASAVRVPVIVHGLIMHTLRATAA